MDKKTELFEQAPIPRAVASMSIPAILSMIVVIIVGGWFASQWIHNENATAALGQAALQAYFRPDDQNVRQLAKRLCPASGADLAMVQKLVFSLKRGQFLLQNSSGKITKITV